MSGGAVDAACRKVRERLFEHVGAAVGRRSAAAGDRRRPTSSTRSTRRAGCRSPRRPPGSCSTRRSSTTTARPRTSTRTARATATPRSRFVAHRAVVDVDPELGLVKVVQIATAQDVGVALNPLSVLGQIEGGIAQGLGLAVMEEIVHAATARSATPASPTTCCRRCSTCPRWSASLIEEPDPQAPLGRQGRRRAAVHLVDPGDRRRHPRRDRQGPRTARRCARRTSCSDRRRSRVWDDRCAEAHASRLRPRQASGVSTSARS